MLRICALLLVVSAAWLSADQEQRAAPSEPTFYAGTWELAVGQYPTNFDRILELKVDGTKLTGTMTMGTLTVKVVGGVDKNFYLRTEVGTDSSPQLEVETFVGATWDGTLLQGTRFRGSGDSSGKTGWAARRPPK